MQEEMTQKTIALVFRATSFTARHFEAVLREAKNDLERADTQAQNRKFQKKQLKAMEKKAGNKKSDDRRDREKKEPPKKRGKQKVSDLIGNGEKVNTIEIPEDIKAFKRVAKKYGVDFAIKKDKSVDPPKYIVFFKAKDTDVLKECFKDYLYKQEKKKTRMPFKQRLKLAKQRMEQRNRKREKKRDRGEPSL